MIFTVKVGHALTSSCIKMDFAVIFHSGSNDLSIDTVLTNIVARAGLWLSGSAYLVYMRY